jgi:hypothetical protein
MNAPQNSFAALAIQAGRGDADARQQLERDLAHVVRRVLQYGHATSALDRRILAEADRHASAQQDRDLLIRKVVSSICPSVIAIQTRVVRSTAETVATFSHADPCWKA